MFRQISILSVAIALAVAMSAAIAAKDVYAASDADQTQASEPQGELVLTCEYVRWISFYNVQTFRAYSLQQPEKSRMLPVGEYQLIDVSMDKGYSLNEKKCTTEQKRFVIKPDETTELQIGSPLMPSVEIDRYDERLFVQYELVDVAGRPFNWPIHFSSPPSFKVYADDEMIYSAKFEYG